jgi:hypothetical protein
MLLYLYTMRTDVSANAPDLAIDSPLSRLIQCRRVVAAIDPPYSPSVNFGKFGLFVKLQCACGLAIL